MASWTKMDVLRELRSALRDPARIGDVAVLKGELSGGGRVRPEVERALAGLAQRFPEVDLEPLRQLPAGTLGRGYADLLDDNGLSPFRLSGRVPTEIVERNIFIARYGLLHDVYHVLTGFDTSWAGELGVWAFVAAQRYTPKHWLAVAFACLLYPLLAPLSIPRLWRSLWQGIAMGRRARSLIAVPLETMWDRPVTELRRELRIEAA